MVVFGSFSGALKRLKMVFLERVLLVFFVCRFFDVILPYNSFIGWIIISGMPWSEVLCG